MATTVVITYSPAKATDMGWLCHQCGANKDEVGLGWPIMHFLETDHADIRPDAEVARSWKGLVED